MNEKKNNSKIAISIIVLVLIIAGISFAYFSMTSKADTQRITTGTLSINFQVGDVIRLEGLTSIPEYMIEDEASEFNFSIENTGNLDGYFNISLNEIEIDDELKDENFKWRLFEEGVKIAEGNFYDVNSNKYYLQKNKKMMSGDKKNYKLIIWINDNNSEQNHMQDKSFAAKITVDAFDRIFVSNETELNKCLSSNSECVLSNDLETTEQFVIGNDSNVVLNLNGNELNYIENTKVDTVLVEKTATVTITGNGTISTHLHGVAPLYNNGTVIIENGTFHREMVEKNNYFVITNHGHITINDINIETGTYNSPLLENGYLDFDGTRYSNNRGNYIEGVNWEFPTMVINGGTFIGGKNSIKRCQWYFNNNWWRFFRYWTI